MSWTLTTSGACIAKAGIGANSAIVASSATLAKWSDDAEGELALLCRKDWVTDYAGIKANYKPSLSEAVSDRVGMRIVSYDMSGYTSRTEAQTILNVLADDYEKLIAALADKKMQDVM